MRYIAIIDEDDMPAVRQHFRIEEVPDPASTLEILEVMLKDEPMTPERWLSFWPLLAGYLMGLAYTQRMGAPTPGEQAFWNRVRNGLSDAWAAYAPAGDREAFNMMMAHGKTPPEP